MVQEMGFGRDAALDALEQYGSAEAAAEWLLGGGRQAAGGFG